MELAPVFTVLGYSVNADRTSLSLGYRVNIEAFSYYEEHMGEMDFGFLIVNADDARANGLLDEDFGLLPSNRGFKAKMYGAPYSYLDVKVTGIVTDAAKALDLLIILVGMLFIWIGTAQNF